MPFPAASIAIAVRLLLCPLKLPEVASGFFALTILVHLLLLRLLLIIIRKPLFRDPKPSPRSPNLPLMQGFQKYPNLSPQRRASCQNQLFKKTQIDPYHRKLISSRKTHLACTSGNLGKNPVQELRKSRKLRQF
jgi:hypothetical protein